MPGITFETRNTFYGRGICPLAVLYFAINAVSLTLEKVSKVQSH